MTALDWVVLAVTVLSIAGWGAWKNRRVESAESYLKGSGLAWPTIGLSIMATQASAITFLSVPGQAYEDGMRFVQFYFGLPLAMVVICVVFVPIYYRLGVYTAYEYLEQRFDVRVRVLTAMLFMIGRGLAAGISIYAPAIVLSAVLGWSLNGTNLLIGLVVIVYTVTGGAKAVSQTQKQQMVVILAGMLVAAGIIAMRLPSGVGLGEVATVSGALGRMNIVDFSIDPNSRYTFWSGITGGFFLALSYFGTDQSQVQRYLGGASLTESRLGLLFNGLLKIPMQLMILSIGLLVFTFHVFDKPPIVFNTPALEAARGLAGPEVEALQDRWDAAFEDRRDRARALVDGDESARDGLVAAQARMDAVRDETRALIEREVPGAETKDADYIFIRFVLQHLPPGVVGLLLAAILMAAMSSTASELSALGSTSVVDLYKRLLRPEPPDREPSASRLADSRTVAASPRDSSLSADEAHTVRVSKAFTVFWGLLAVGFATFASLLDNLIEAVNILGSIFYGVILGIFLVAFFAKRVGGDAVLGAAAVAQATVVVLFFYSDIGFLWFNMIGCMLVVLLALGIQAVPGVPPRRSVS
ncbi:MAG: sodium:solute symporter [Myxococcota bacterium]